MRQYFTIGLAAFLVSFTSGAMAADVEDDDIAKRDGAYVVARLAGAFNNNSQYSMAFSAYTTDIVTQYEKTSYAGAMAVGYRFEDMFGIEVEAGQTALKAVAHTLLSVPTSSTTVASRFDGGRAGGGVQVTYGMFNIVSEQDMGTFVRPYVSAGLGMAQVSVNDFNINLPAPIDPLKAGKATLINDKEISYAWQIGVGAVMDISKELSLEAGYRYFRVEDIDVRTNTGNETAFNLSQHQLLLGARINF